MSTYAACNCHEKASSCKYNRTVNDLGLSMNIDGRYNGGGVCLSCQVKYVIRAILYVVIIVLVVVALAVDVDVTVM